ncbi:MAG: hypothetical protein RL077_1425 [Verrucomicrobiota bacterium]
MPQLLRLLLCVFRCLLGGAALVASLGSAAISSALPRSAPEDQGVSSAALLGFVAAAEEKIDALHSVMIMRHGHVIAEGWWAPYAAAEPHQLFSLSKSFTSTAVGLAIADGKLSLDAPVLSFFPHEAPAQTSVNLRAMRVRDLLTMSTGHHLETIQAFDWKSAESLVKTFLALPVTHKPGTFFVYNTPATYMLSAIVQKVTGQKVVDYLQPRLFSPLGIAPPVWEESPQGISLGGFGLNLRTEDIARFGQLYLQRGQWQGQPLVPSQWIDTATARWVSNGSNPASDWEQGYGFQFWRCRFGVIRGDGAHGQFCLFFPEQDAAVAITAGTRDLQGVLSVVWSHLLPALQGTALPRAPSQEAALQRRLAGLTLRAPAATGVPATAAAYLGHRYAFPANAHGIAAITVAPTDSVVNGFSISLTIEGAEQRLRLVPGEWSRSELTAGPAAGPVAASGGWTGPDTLTFDVVRYQTPFAMRYRLTFSGDQVTLSAEPNVGPAAGGLKSVLGQRRADL